MSDRRTLATRLQSIGATEAPPLTDDRLAALEQRIALRTPLPRRRAARPRPRVLHVWVAAAAVVVLSVLAVVSFGGSSDALRFTAADGVVVEAPGAVARPVRAGDEVPEGAVVEVAAGGTAAIGRDRFGPGRYVVVAGRLASLTPTTVVERSPTTAPAPSTSTAVPALPPRTAPATAPDVASSTASRGVGGDTTVTSTAPGRADTTPRTTAPPPTRAAATAPATRASVPDRSTTTVAPARTTTTAGGRTSTSRGR